MRALFIVDNRRGAGLGHVYRSGALSAELGTLGWETATIGPNDTLPSGVRDLVIMDVRTDVRPSVSPLRSVQIIDEPTPVPSCQLLVSGSAGATPSMFAGLGAARVLAGPQYSLLRSAFLKIRNGGTRERKGILDIRRIGGWDVEPLALEIASASVAIAYGGMRALECACVGTPTVLIPRNDGERLNIVGLLALGACVMSDDEDAQTMAETMLDCPRLLLKMGENARGMVDGKGARRVARIITELVR